MSKVIEQSRPEATPIPGVAHSTWASATDGLSQISIWRQNLAPGAATPPHRHDCASPSPAGEPLSRTKRNGRWSWSKR